MGDEVDFLPSDKRDSFLRVIVSLSVCIASILKVPKTISLQYFKENVKDEVQFLPLDKRQRFLQIDTVI